MNLNALVEGDENELEAIQNDENQNEDGQAGDIQADDEEEEDDDIEDIANRDKLEIGSRRIVINNDEENKFNGDKNNNNNSKIDNNNKSKSRQVYNPNQVELRKSRGMSINLY